MDVASLVASLQKRGVALRPDISGELVAKPSAKLTEADRSAIRKHKAELLRVLRLDVIEASLKPGEWLAYREKEALLTAKFAGTSIGGAVNVWLADGAVRAIAAESVALDWVPNEAEVLEERLCIMLASGVAEDVARVRAEECTREYVDRLRVVQ